MTTKNPKKTEAKDYVPIGKLYNELQQKEQPVIDLQSLREEFTKDYMKNLEIAAMKGKKRFNKTFYVVVLIRKERLMRKVVRSGFLSRATCPTPNYDQTVYSFDPISEDLKFLWVIPSKEVCERIYSSKYSLNPTTNALMPYVVNFMEGRLWLKAKELNGETSEPGYKLEDK